MSHRCNLNCTCGSQCAQEAAHQSPCNCGDDLSRRPVDLSNIKFVPLTTELWEECARNPHGGILSILGVQVITATDKHDENDTVEGDGWVTVWPPKGA